MLVQAHAQILYKGQTTSATAAPLARLNVTFWLVSAAVSCVVTVLIVLALESEGFFHSDGFGWAEDGADKDAVTAAKASASRKTRASTRRSRAPASG